MMWLSKQETAQRLGICIRSLERFMRDGAIPYYRVGARLIRFDERDVEAYIRSCRREGPSRSNAQQEGRLTWRPGMKVI